MKKKETLKKKYNKIKGFSTIFFRSKLNYTVNYTKIQYTIPTKKEGIPMEELQIHRNLFEKYLYLLHAGKNKTEAIKEVAKKEGYSESAIWKYKRTFNWDEREIIRSKEINKKTEEKANETIADMKVEFMGNYRIIIRQWMEKLRLNEIPIEKASATEIS